ncbi:beta-glucosidase [Raineyella antarctica]|uniref:beta-glucosidase n=1 Tax=Raineyella antarctica TaxID=1577474 RepID=A0A1G6I6B3_9ACTN|nr:glycoside hydrolase family 3 N-terminal domain-containing protein [Raineyella antarctica]SDC01575.1 beta-glucosidase [Raineyella antarctica]
MTTADTASNRVEHLLGQLSTAEKVGQLVQYFHMEPSQTEQAEAALARGGAGSLLFITDPAEINRLQRLSIEGSPHGIPVLFGFDVIHGLRTIFPVPIGLAASWDPELVERSQAVAAREARAVGIHWTFAPMVDIARDPRWGRMVEGAGEDPYLGAMMAAAQVRGFQGGRRGVVGDGTGTVNGTGRIADGHLIAGPKHFVGYGAALGGRDYDEADLSDQELRNVYLPPFRAAIEAGAGNIMCAYMDLNGVPATGNRRLLTDILRDELGFDGWVVSDANSVRDLATHHFAADLADAGERALTAGVDMEMAIHDPAFDQLVAAVGAGRISTERLDASVRRVLSAKEAMGLFDDPYVDEDAARTILTDPAHRVAAREAAEAAAVLLRNEGDLLPLRAESLRKVAVIGPMADSRRDTLGPWVFGYDLDETVSVLDGLRARLGGPARVTFAPGVPLDQRVFPSLFEPMGEGSAGSPPDFDADAEFERALRVAEDADVAVVVLGERQDMIGENASRSTLELPGDQLGLLEAVVETGTPTVLVLFSGRPLDLRWAAKNVPAILEVWYPGSQGGAAVANLLLGDATPAGKLPFTWPRTVGQVPMPYSHTRSHDPDQQDRRYWDEQSTPLYPFGHGLSYARFSYADLRVESGTTSIEGASSDGTTLDGATLDRTLTVSVDVTNTSARDGVEVVQLYLHQRYGASSRPVRLLKGFRRVPIAAGATQTVAFTIGPEERRYWSSGTGDWTLDATTFDVWVGGDSTATLHAEFTVGAEPGPR